MSYCSFARALPVGDPHREYHDGGYGFPRESDDELFGLLLLEINQAGLSWATVLKKEPNFRRAYAGFSIEKVAGFSLEDVERLLADAGIVRNRMKINAAIENAKRLLTIRKNYGSFGAWLDLHRGKSREEWMAIFKKTFTFTGGKIVNEFLMSTGHLPGAHEETCPFFESVP